MRLLLLGADGQLGFELHRQLAPLGVVVPATLTGVLPDGSACARAELGEGAQLAELVRETQPDWIINAAAYTAVDRAEDERDAAQRVNGDALAVLGQEAARRGAAVLHYSTDYVFPGDGARPWREDDLPAPLNHYGATKLAGEKALAVSGARHLVLRTAWVYGARGHNFLLTMLKLARSRERLTVVDDQHGTPTSARYLAAASVQLIARADPAVRDDWGVFHLTASGETTWCGFAREIVARAVAAGLLARAPAVEPIASADFPTRARRPFRSVLDCARIEARFGLHRPDWREGVGACIAELAEARRAAG